MAIQLFTDNNLNVHSREIFTSQPMTGAVTVSVADTPSVTDFKGFGVAITGSSCYLLNQMDKAERTSLLKSIYSKDGLGLNVARLTVGASDYSAKLYSYDDVPFDTDLSHFSIAHDEEYIIPMIREILAINPDLYIFASPWSPPGWMKTGGNLCGGYMRDEYVDCFAEYVVKYIKAYREHGINISALTPQNEPETQHSHNMPCCIWHPETEARYIKTLSKKLKENGLSVKIWMHDHNFNGVDRVLWTLDNTDVSDYCDGVAFHYYSGNIEQTVKLKQKYPDLDLHFTEGGPRLADNYATDWCKWSIMMLKALKCGYKSFTGWNLMLDEMGGPNIGPFLCGGLVTRHSVTGEIEYSGQYKAFSHIAKYITADCAVYPLITDENVDMSKYPKTPKSVEGVAIVNSDGVSVYVMVNANAEKKQVQFFANGNNYYTELMPDSVSTIIL